MSNHLAPFDDVPDNVPDDVPLADHDDDAQLPDEDIARLRCEAAAEAVRNLQDELIQFLDSGQRAAPENLFDAVESFLTIVGERADVAWPRPCWIFVEAATTIGTIVGQAGHRWRVSGDPWNYALCNPIKAAGAERGNLLDPKVPQPRTVQLESIEEFIEQKLSNRQIAICYDWYDGNGEPDQKKARACRLGKVDAPTSKTYLPHFAGPSRQPHLGAIDQALAIFQEQKEEEAREAIEV